MARDPLPATIPRLLAGFVVALAMPIGALMGAFVWVTVPVAAAVFLAAVWLRYRVCRFAYVMPFMFALCFLADLFFTGLSMIFCPATAVVAMIESWAGFFGLSVLACAGFVFWGATRGRQLERGGWPELQIDEARSWIGRDPQSSEAVARAGRGGVFALVGGGLGVFLVGLLKAFSDEPLYKLALVGLSMALAVGCAFVAARAINMYRLVRRLEVQRQGRPYLPWGLPEIEEVRSKEWMGRLLLSRRR